MTPHRGFTSDGQMYFVGVRVVIDCVANAVARAEWDALDAAARERYEQAGKEYARRLHAPLN